MTFGKAPLLDGERKELQGLLLRLYQNMEKRSWTKLAYNDFDRASRGSMYNWRKGRGGTLDVLNRARELVTNEINSKREQLKENDDG